MRWFEKNEDSGGKRENKPAYDESRRDFLKKAGAASLAVAFGTVGKMAHEATEKAEQRVHDRKRAEADDKRIEELRDKLAEKEVLVTENPLDSILSYDGVKPLSEESFARLVDHMEWQHTEGDFREEFEHSIAGFGHNKETIQRIFAEAGVPIRFSLVSIFEAYWYEDKWGSGGPFQVSDWAAGRFRVDPRNVPGSAEGAAKLFAEIPKMVGPDERFRVLSYNGSFLWRYLKQSKGDPSQTEGPSLNGFLMFMTEKAESRRKKLRSLYGEAEKGRKLFASDIDEGIAGIRINLEYLAKYLAVKRIFESRPDLLAMLDGTDSAMTV